MEKQQCLEQKKQNCMWTQNCQKKECRYINDRFTFQQCQDYEKSCTVRVIQGCREILLVCEGYLYEDECIVRGHYIDNIFTTFPCYWGRYNCVDLITKTCGEAKFNSYDNEACQKYSENCIQTNPDVTSYPDYCVENPKECNLKKLKSSCLTKNIKYNIECIWNQKEQECIEKSCTNAVIHFQQTLILQFSFETCQNYSEICIPNKDLTGCIDRPNNCQELSKSNCQDIRSGQKAYCIWNETQCEEIKCSDLQLQTQEDCLNAIPNIQCIINNEKNGCQPLQENCQAYKIKDNCQFSNSYKECYWNVIEQNCVNKVCAELEQNQSFDTQEKCLQMKCILNQKGEGCQDIGNCWNYDETQCSNGSMDQNSQACGWNTNLSVPACEIKQCSTASSSIVTHQDCNSYLEGCTVNVQYNNDQMQTGGCIKFQECSMYLTEDQCQFNQDNIECGWNGKKCDIKSCQTAPQTTDYSTLEGCSKYLEGCTVNSNQLGCIQMSPCELYIIEEQCVTSDSREQCLWLEEEQQCVIRTCDRAPDSYNSEEGCHNFSPSCYYNSQKSECKAPSQFYCEDYKFQTELECKNGSKYCTTNGRICVSEISVCEEAIVKEACTKTNQNQCEWVAFVDPPHCMEKSCETAPISITKEEDCIAYFSKDCTIKQNGGCRKKGSCSENFSSEACKTDISGNICVWVDNSCKLAECEDLSGITYAQCNLQKSQCTIGKNGKCMSKQECSQYESEDQCVISTYYPCLWIQTQIDQNQTKGACFQYYSCESILWDTDEKCKKISSQCTTNGQICVSITKCSDSYLQGCVTGTDGDCIAVDGKCKKFVSCSEAKYFTHESCQAASQHCTTDFQSGCIELKQNCSDYSKKEYCLLNKQGKIYQNENLISTGKCIWKSGQCQDVTCEDIDFAECDSSLSYCTTNGSSCVKQISCNQNKNQDKCSKYNEFVGFCVWKDSACIAMDNCAAASKNQQACVAVNDRCQWIYSAGSSAGQCIDHTCESYFKTFSQCKRIANWNYSQQQFCAINSLGQCSLIDPKTLSQVDCSISTYFSFRWNQRCEACQEIKEIPDFIETSNFYPEIQINVVIAKDMRRINLGLMILLINM